MARSLVSWWREDTARNTFVYTQFLISLPFTVFGTYSVYQLQVLGFLIGNDGEGGPCLTYCIVPFGGGQLDLNSVLLYMNAMTFGIGGFIMIFLTAYADFWKNKSLITTLLIISYGAFTVPSYWLRDVSLSNFNSFIALYVMYGVVTFILIAMLNIYIPYCMRLATEKEKERETEAAQALPPAREEPEQLKDAGGDAEAGAGTGRGWGATARRYGFSMSIFGTLANALSGSLMLAIVIIIAATRPGPDGQSAGLLVTTIIGFVTMAGALVAYWGLPPLPTKSYAAGGGTGGALLELLTPYREMLYRKRNMLFLLVAYTIYTDTLFAMFSITGQLYYIEVQPDTLEFSLYTLAGNLYNLVLTLVFYMLQLRFKWDLSKCLLFGYVLILVPPVWGCIGLASNIDFGFKNRWEFYVQLLVAYTSQAVVNPTFRLLYAELIPKGEEIMWFGLQVILSSATTWINYVASGPLQNATHQLRFPLVLCLVFFVISLTLETLRGTLGLFKRERAEWLREQEASAIAEANASASDTASTTVVSVNAK